MTRAMTEQTTALAPTAQVQAVIALALDGLGSGHSRRAYGGVAERRCSR